MKTRPEKRREPGGKTNVGVFAPPGHRYLELVREKPLRVIRTEDEYEHAIAMIDRLSDRGTARTSDETEYLLALSVFVGKYEEDHHQIPPVSGVDVALLD